MASWREKEIRMEERHEFIETMQRALERLQVKASLAKLELGHVKDELLHEYDKLHDKLRDMREENEDEWAAVKGGFLSSWDAFKERFHRTVKEPDES
ncbi:MAG: hypothetical protein ACYTGZ_21500 [Planctomycetota bacterium]